MSARPRARRRAAAATALAVLGGIATLVTTDADRALAVVEHRSGFDATVLGWTSWYGSYGLGDQGLGWCIDHGLLAPDAAYGYVPIVPPMDERTGAAVSWVVAAGELADRPGAAAIMLVLHDLMGATYPFGRLDVDALGLANLGGFGGAEAAVLDRARALKRWGLAHAGLRGPYRIDLEADAVASGAVGEVRGALVDRDGRPISGIAVALAASGELQDRTVVTDDAGRFHTSARAIEGANAFLARATLPSPTPRILAPTRAAAQRIAQPSFADAMGGTAFALPPSTTTKHPPTTPPTTAPPTVTSTTVPSTSTSTSSTTSTTVPSTSTTVPSTSTTPTSSTTTTATVPPSSTTPPPSVPPGATSPPAIALPPPAAPQLPVTGSSSAPLALVGLGLVISGGAVVSTARRRDGRWRRRSTV